MAPKFLLVVFALLKSLTQQGHQCKADSFADLLEYPTVCIIIQDKHNSLVTKL
ncbi:hypothetical protein PR003_g7252 [Phytophthora rubi]|uniref:RxLR effector protein n=1 Tax=Phytophthora rubi TaxID=129364 RepID=A0A6A4FKE2_9STRA|nr:hypothetical protein PR001_g9652 [Phytophthora rubi]KAE9036295.1 hypothetical protein PR002_g7155 [Phytophthora rubi]KAE9346800.1 hypothetical protein PR003_g7252 [Phytophthora rubi]